MLPDVIRSRYSRKFAVIGLVVIVIVSSIGLVTQREVSNDLTADKRTTVRTNAQLEAETLGQWLQGQKQQIRSISNDREMQSGDPVIVRASLQRELSQLPPEVVALHYVERDTQRIVASTNTTLEGKRTDTNQSIEGSLEPGQVYWNPDVGFNFTGSTTVIESFVYKEGDEPSVALASPAPRTDHVVVMIIRTNVRAKQFSSSIAGTRTVAIGGFTGLILFSENKSEILTPYGGETNTTVERRVLDVNVSNTGSLITDDNVVGYASVPSTDWVVVKEAPKKTALSLQREIQRNLLGLILAALLGLLVLNAVTALGPMRSLRKLSRQAQSIAAGDLSTKIEDDGRVDEVGAVRDSFRDIKQYLDTATAQSDALAKQEFDDPILDEEVPGSLGTSLQRTRRDLETFIDDLETTRNQAEIARIQAEQKNEQLQVVDRLLRHNLKNDMSIIQLSARSIIEIAHASGADTQVGDREHGQQEFEQITEYAEKIRETVDSILEKTAKQRQATKVLLSDRPPSDVDVVTALERSRSSLLDAYPAVEISLDGPTSATVTAIPSLGDAFTELLENAITHCDHDSPEIEITVTGSEQTVEIQITDNGPGIPAPDRQVLAGETETDQLNHGTGIGLWFVYWTIQESGGRIRYEPNNPRGSVITIVLQTASVVTG